MSSTESMPSTSGRGTDAQASSRHARASLKRHLEVDGATSSVEQQASSKRRKSCPSLEVSLFVKWYSITGKTRMSQLPLVPLEDGINGLKGLSKHLVVRAYPDPQRPAYLTSPDYYKYTPTEECMSLPNDVSRTEFRLVVNHDGWEYVIYQRELEGERNAENCRKMLVTVVEFESTALIIGHLGVTLTLVSYPIISISKTFLDDVEHQLKTNPSFKGILLDSTAPQS